MGYPALVCDVTHSQNENLAVWSQICLLIVRHPISYGICGQFSSAHLDTIFSFASLQTRRCCCHKEMGQCTHTLTVQEQKGNLIIFLKGVRQVITYYTYPPRKNVVSKFRAHISIPVLAQCFTSAPSSTQVEGN